jgi:hypothetical protein
MNYHGLVKSLDLPAGWMPPTELEYDDIRARAISRADLHDDVQGINASIELIQRTRAVAPAEPVSADFNYVHLVWHELEFRESYSFTYAVYDSRGHYLGRLRAGRVGERGVVTGLSRCRREHRHRPPRVGRGVPGHITRQHGTEVVTGPVSRRHHPGVPGMRVGGAGLTRHPRPDRPCARHVSVTESCTSLVCCPPSDNGTRSYRGQHRSPVLVGPAGLSEHG